MKWKYYDAAYFIDRMMNFYKVDTMQKLAQIIGITQQSISKWKKNNYIKAMERKCEELGIYKEIFGDFNSNIAQDVHTVLKKDEIKINDTLLEKAKDEASKFGLDINSYLEHLIIQDLKK